MSEEFVTLSEIKTNSNKLNEHFMDEIDQLNKIDEGIPVYQVQGILNNSKALVMKVGIIEELNDVLIKDFEIVSRFKCFMVSRIYDQQLLEKTNGHYKLNMIKVTICQNSNPPIPIAALCYNFNHSQNDSIINYLSTQIQRIEVNGFYNITLHYKENNNKKNNNKENNNKKNNNKENNNKENNNNKYIELSKFEIYQGEQQMMISLTKSLLDPKVLEILNDIKI